MLGFQYCISGVSLRAVRVWCVPYGAAEEEANLARKEWYVRQLEPQSRSTFGQAGFCLAALRNQTPCKCENRRLAM